MNVANSNQTFFATNSCKKIVPGMECQVDISLLWVNGLESTTINSEKYTLNFSTDLGLSQLMINQQKIKEAGKPKSDPRQKHD